MNSHRELNPALFGDRSVVADPFAGPDTRYTAASVMGAAANESGRTVPYPPIDYRTLEGDLKSLRTALVQMDKRTEMLALKMEELARSVHTRMERLGQKLQSFEESQNKAQNETAQRFSMVVAKVNERKVTDVKIQDMMDRHNTIVRNFENRLTSLQRLVSEQQMSLHNAQAALEESRAEISRLLKR